MKVVLLTTQTTHHAYYVAELQEHIRLAGVLIEESAIRPPFPTAHAFEYRRDTFESLTLLKDRSEQIADMAPAVSVPEVSDPEALTILKKWAPDVIVVFGTGLLPKPIIDLPKLACLNLHGGDPEHYRGLDSHLWAIYHGEFHRLVTTLHLLEERFDTGAIVGQRKLQFGRRHRLEHVRAVNTRACVELTVGALRELETNGYLPTREQKQVGRYYSMMPAVLKDRCVKQFEKYTNQLEDLHDGLLCVS